MRIEGEKATVFEVLTTRPAGGDTKARLRYFYTRSFVRRDDRWPLPSSRMVSLAAGRAKT